jgi:hypothetical protein
LTASKTSSSGFGCRSRRQATSVLLPLSITLAVGRRRGASAQRRITLDYFRNLVGRMKLFEVSNHFLVTS